MNASLSQTTLTTKYRVLCKATASLIVATGISAFVPFNAALAQSIDYGVGSQYSDSLTRKIYGGIGFGQSFLEPDTSQVDGVETNNRVNNAGQVMLGLDINKWFSVEGHAATLGSAGLAPSGELSYQTLGLSALAYAGKGRHRYNRRGLTAFGRAGVGYLRNEASDGLEFEQVNSSHLLLGAGLEYSTSIGLGIRAEGILFDADVRLGQLSVLYRLGKRRSSRLPRIVEAPAPAPSSLIIEPLPVESLLPVPAIAIAPSDSDFDGVNDLADQCLTTAVGVGVDASGCAIFNGVIEGVNFSTGSAQLTQSAEGILNGVVSTLSQNPSSSIAIMAHTDSQGDENQNQALSRERARSVAKYLVQNGISVQRLSAFGYGENQPIDSNETAEGRKRNRRVEFRSVQ